GMRFASTLDSSLPRTKVLFCKRRNSRYSKGVKRKRPPVPDSVRQEAIVPEVILEQAKRAIESDRRRKSTSCVVCGEDCAPNSEEGLCWVCRRLKLSAWRDSDSQMPAQE